MTDSHLWITGDMNLPGYNWNTQCLKLHFHFPELATKFADVLDDKSLLQIVTEPTRNENTLNLFITNKESLVNKVFSLVLVYLVCHRYNN